MNQILDVSLYIDHTGVYVSKDNGLTWTKRVGNSLTRSVYGGKFVDVGTSLSLITKRNQRTDGSSISPDVITIGLEGSTTVIENLVARNVNVSTIGYGPSNALSIAGNVNVSMGSPTTVLSFTTSSVVGAFGRIAFGGGKFVVYGYPSKLYYSTNGTTWTLGTYPTIIFGARILVYTSDRFLFFSQSAPTIMYTSMDGITWNTTSFVTTSPYDQITRVAYGNNVVIVTQNGTANLSVSTNNTGTTWTNITLANGTINQVGFGKLSYGTNPNVFLIVGQDLVKRADKAVPNAQGDWLNPTNTPLGNWLYIGFGNDTFMITSSDTPGKLSISTNGGLAWSTPIDFGIKLRQPVYIEGDWYIGSDTYIMISKDNGVTWEKKLGKDCETFAYGNKLLVSVNDTGDTNNQINLIGIKKTKDDSSLITSDTITIGSDAATTKIGASGIKFDTLYTDNPTGNHLLYPNKTSGTLSIANAQTSGNINIGGAGSIININGNLGSNSGTSQMIGIYRFGGTSGGAYVSGSEPDLENGKHMTMMSGAYTKIIWYYNWSMWAENGGSMYFYYGVSPETGTAVTAAARISGAGAFITISDIRKKQDIKDLTYGLDTIQQLRPVSFSYKTTPNETELGFIAQEVEIICPEIVDLDGKEEDEAVKGLKYIGFVPILVKAVQEIKLDYEAKIKELKEDYDAKLSKLEARILVLETR